MELLEMIFEKVFRFIWESVFVTIFRIIKEVIFDGILQGIWELLKWGGRNLWKYISR